MIDRAEAIATLLHKATAAAKLSRQGIAVSAFHYPMWIDVGTLRYIRVEPGSRRGSLVNWYHIDGFEYWGDKVIDSWASMTWLPYDPISPLELLARQLEGGQT